MEEGGKAKLTIERKKGVITSEDIEELRESIIATFDPDFDRVKFLAVVTPK